MSRKLIGIILIIVTFMYSCKSDKHSIPVSLDFKGFESWISDEENGLVKIREYHGLEFSMFYLPSTYLAYKDKKQANIMNKDSLIDYYSQTLNFMMRVRLIDKNPNVLYLGISSIEEYKERIMQLNFGLDSLLKMHIKSKEYVPILTSFENTYGISPYANVNIVFILPKDIKEGDEVDISFQDDIFNTGIQHFLFDYTQMKTVPIIK